MNTKVQFRVLYRQFLFRLMDLELLSASAGGDASELLGQLGALLIFGSLLLAFLAIPLGEDVRGKASAVALWPMERFLISLTMLVVGSFAILSWDTTFPDRRDVLVLGPLPVRARTLLAAKIAASASALGLIVAAWNSLAGFAWPLALAPASCGFACRLRFVAAFWATLLAGAIFLYSLVLGVQAAAAQLPRGWYLRISSFLQMALLILFLTVTLFQPSIDTPMALSAPENQRTLAWLPSYWFVGLLSELSGLFRAEGHAAMAPLARRAVFGLLIAVLIAGGAFLLSYVRTLRKIIEQPDIIPGARGGMWLPQLGSPPQTALAHFIIRTLMRSRRHRTILSFYLGGGFAIAAVSLQGAKQAMHLTWTNIFQHSNVLVLFASILILCALWLGMRTVFSLPLDIRANWLFRVVPTPTGAAALAAIRRALLAVSVLPVVVLSAPLLWLWSWRTAAEHLLLLALLGALLADISLNNFRKIPFTCSYLPGKSKAHIVFWFGIIPLILLIEKVAELELRAISSLLSYCCVAVVLALAVFAVRRLNGISADRDVTGIQFEQSRSDELIGLALDR